MQFSIAKEILDECNGDVSDAQEKILPKNGNRRKRMNEFLQFILQEDYNVVVFEEMLRNSGFDELFDNIKCESENTEYETKDFGMFFTLTYTEKLFFKFHSIISARFFSYCNFHPYFVLRKLITRK